jgi:hypothetical protein
MSHPVTYDYFKYYLVGFMRIAGAILLLTIAFSGIAALFWYQEIQYLLPTPVPKGYAVILPNDIIKFDSALLPQQYAKPKLLHFFSPDCPCSRFNLKHFASLRKKYSQQIDFYVVIAKREDVTSARYMLEKTIPIVVDKGEKLAKACGVYSTPQAALIQRSNKLYFRGNYNRSRFCTDKNSNFVQMALDSLLARREPPHFIELATQSYGCSIAQEQDTTSIIVQ